MRYTLCTVQYASNWISGNILWGTTVNPHILSFLGQAQLKLEQSFTLIKISCINLIKLNKNGCY